MNSKLTQLLVEANLRKTGWDDAYKPYVGFILGWGFSVAYDLGKAFLEFEFSICLHSLTNLGWKF